MKRRQECLMHIWNKKCKDIKGDDNDQLPVDSVECAISNVPADDADLECVRVVTVVADKVEG